MVAQPRVKFFSSMCIHHLDREYDIFKWIPAEDSAITIRAGTEGKRVYIIENRQTCLMKALLPSACQGWTSTWKTDEDQYNFVEVERPCSGTCCGLSRPYAEVFQVMEDGNTRERFGRVELPYSYEEVKNNKDIGSYLSAFQVKGWDNLGNLQWVMKGSKCDPYFCCPATSGSCSLARF